MIFVTTLSCKVCLGKVSTVKADNLEKLTVDKYFLYFRQRVKPTWRFSNAFFTCEFKW